MEKELTHEQLEAIHKNFAQMIADMVRAKLPNPK